MNAPAWSARQEFAREIERPEEDIDLARVALLVAREEYVQLPVERYLVRLVPRDGRLVPWQGADWALRYFDPGQRPDLEARAAARAQ